MLFHCFIFVVLWAHSSWWVAPFFFISLSYYTCCDMSCVKSYGKFNNADSIQVHTVPFMVHISSTRVVKYLVVIRAYLFKWWGNIKYHRFSAETGQWLSTDVCQLGKVHWSVWLRVWVSLDRWSRSTKAERLCHHEADWSFPQHLYI